jgi:tetratricopeptide (TPR) repeat protein/tRNA A-37 threonylcarbamoyl transferase component Bud32
METDPRVDGLVDGWELMHKQGAPLTIEELCADCPELVAEVRRRIQALQAMDSALGTTGTELGPTPGDERWDGVGAYRMVPDVLHAAAVYRPRSHHHQGGLGVVFTAYQEELDRTVALKRIRPDKLHEAARRRFLREAALTARLQHPGIVPIYGLGEYEGGPFYTMPFIQGQTLQEAIDAFHGAESLGGDPGRRKLRFRGLLQQFVTACNTVAYAHDQGVVHRDLKPSNLMLGPYGEILVLDWGLAKRFGRDETASDGAEDTPSPGPSSEDVTATGEVLGTPQYMSPEQAKGESAGPASDIFSLGLVLYAILTGKTAFEEPIEGGADRLKAVREAAIVRPRRRDASLPRNLEAICLKALAAKPEDRYTSARALAEDVTRWLAAEPVTAWREPVLLRGRRWARRHRTAVAALLVALLAALVGLGAVAGVQARANERLRRANAEIKRANAQTTEALAQSEESRKQAEAVSTFLVKAFRSPDPEQDGRQVKVADVLDRASHELDKGFSGSQTSQAALREALGRTFYDLGLYDRSASSHTKARALREAALGPEHPDTLTSCHNVATAYHDAGLLSQAIALYEETLTRRVAKLGPDHPHTLLTRSNLATAYAVTGRISEAIPLFEATLKFRRATLGADHADALGSANNLAIAYRVVGRLAAAIALHEATLKLQQAKLGFDNPDTLDSCTNLLLAYADAGQFSDAIALHEATLKRYEAKLAPDHPRTLNCRSNLASAYANAGRLSEAIVLHKSTLNLRVDKLGPDHPDTLESRQHLAAACESLGRWSEAEGLYCDTLTRRRKSERADSRVLADDLAPLGRNLLLQGRWSEAGSLLREALTIREKTGSDEWSRYDAMSLLGGALLGQKRYAEAEPLLVSGCEGMKARQARIAVPDKFRLLPAAERVVRLYEEWGQPQKAAFWKDKTGMRDLPANVFAPG